MSSAPQPPDVQPEAPKEKDHRTPGLRGVRTTTLFRAVNPELFIKPNKAVMAFGLVTITLCVAYIGYLHAQQENRKDLYEAIDGEGNRLMKQIGADLKQEDADQRELEIQKRIQRMQTKLLLQAETEKEDAVEDALNRAETLHKEDMEDLKKAHEQTLEEAMKKTRAEMLQHLEVELKRESEAAEQRNSHKLQRMMLQFAMEKMAAVAEARQDERHKTAVLLAKQEKGYLEQIHQAGIIANEIYQKNLQRLAWEKRHELETAFKVSQKEFEEESKKLLETAENIRAAQLEEVNTEVNRKSCEILSLKEQLDYMTAWKDSLEAEILEIREAFQNYINLTFPQLAPGQADFILPFRKKTSFTDSGVEQ